MSHKTASPLNATDKIDLDKLGKFELGGLPTYRICRICTRYDKVYRTDPALYFDDEELSNLDAC